jgi:DNA-directed RNA polymerase specialized sigma subunit
MLEYIYKVSQSYNDLSIIHNKNLSTLYRDLYVIGASVERFGAALNWSKAYYREYIKFRNMIMEKYVRFAWNQSQKSKFETNLVVDYEELHINYMLAVVKAIDRYDPTRGPLTACVRGWIQEAKTNPKFNHVYGQSYEMNQEKRNLIIAENKQNSFSDQLENNLEVQDTKDLESALAIDQERSELYDFLVKTKGTKIARLSYGIPYSLSDEEKQSLLSLQEIKS